MSQTAEVLESVHLNGVLDEESGDSVDVSDIAKAMYEAAEQQLPVELAFPKRVTRRSILNEKDRIVQAVVSTSHVDRYYTIIDPAGIETENYFSSGAPVLWSHGHTLATLGDVPIGTTLELSPSESELSAKWRWANFDDQPVEKWGHVARAIEDLWYLYRGGHLGAYSVTILPKEIEPGRNGKPPVFRKSELLEFSLTSVPVNPHATAADEKAMRYFRKHVGVNAFPRVLQEAVTEAVRESARKVALFTVKQELELFRACQQLDELRSVGVPLALSFAKERFSQKEALERTRQYSLTPETVQDTENAWVICLQGDNPHECTTVSRSIAQGVNVLLKTPDNNSTDFMYSTGTMPWNVPGTGGTDQTEGEPSDEESRASAVRVNGEGKSHAKKLISSGDVDRDSTWSFDADDGNKLLGPNGDDWDNYSKFHLGIRSGTSPKTKEHYAYPYGKNGKVYRRGLIAAKQRASQQGHTSVAKAADELLQLIDKDKEEKAIQRSIRLLPHIAARIFGTPLLVDPNKLEIILGVLGERIGLENTPNAINGESTGSAPKQYSVLNGVAVVPVHGTLVYRTLGLHPMSQLTSYEQVEQMFLAALNDPSVSAVLLDVDSPGGEAVGAFDLADTIYQSRGKKPIWAIANPEAFSAAYAIASAADTVVAPRMGQVGSIGVYALHVDQSGHDEQAGLKYTFIHAGEHKVDGNPHEPLSEDARERIQRIVDDTYNDFVKLVARNRGLSEDAVRATEALTYTASEALSLGLVDQVSTFANVVATLAQPRTVQEEDGIQNVKSSIETIRQQNESLRKLVLLAAEGKLRKRP